MASAVVLAALNGAFPAAADPDTPVEGLPAGGHLQRTLLDDLPVLDPVEAEAEVLASAGRLLHRHPGLR